MGLVRWFSCFSAFSLFSHPTSSFSFLSRLLTVRLRTEFPAAFLPPSRLCPVNYARIGDPAAGDDAPFICQDTTSPYSVRSLSFPSLLSSTWKSG